MTGKHRITVDGFNNDHCNTCGQYTEWHEFYSAKLGRTVHLVRHDPRDREARPFRIDPEYRRYPLVTT